MTNKIISRQEAKLLNQKFYFTGNSCLRGHVSKRYTKKAECVECVSLKGKKRDKIKQKEYAKNHRLKNTELLKVKNKIYLQLNPFINVLYRERNLETLKEKARIYRKENKEKERVRETRRRYSKVNATPKWLTKYHKIQMESFYKDAIDLSVETGVKHHVDHIVPIRGKNVCGLHVPWNLQILRYDENIKKSNKF